VFFLTVNGKIDLRDRITQSANIQLTSQQAQEPGGMSNGHGGRY
jgi:hypothetical protein